MKWLKDLFQPKHLEGLKYNLEDQPTQKSSKQSPKKENLEESVNRYKKEKEEIEKRMLEENKQNEEYIPNLPEGMDFNDPMIRKPKTGKPEDYLAVKVPLSQLSLIQRQHTSFIMDYGFIQWNMTKSAPLSRGVLIENKLKASNEENIYNEYLLAKETGEYKYFPFDDALMGEVRGRVLNLLKENDTLDSLLNRFYELLPNYANDEDIVIIKALVNKTRSELEKRSYTFPFSVKDDVLRDEVRQDGLDFLGLKELVEAMEGADVEQINLMTGFFSRMTEFFNVVYDELYPNPVVLNPQGFYRLSKTGEIHNHIAGIILAVKDNKLIHIKVARVYNGNRRIVFPSRKHDEDVANAFKTVRDDNQGLNDYSPVIASYCMFLTYNIKQKVKALTYEEETKDGRITSAIDADFDTTNLPVKGNALDNANYYVIVNGCIAGPKDFSYDLGGLIKNTERINAGEVYLYHKLNGINNAVRLGFTPHNYDLIHPMLRTGGLVLGNSDMTHHSTTRCRENFAEDVVNDYKTWWAKLVKEDPNSQGDAYSPAMVSGYLHNLMKQPTTNSCFTLELLKKENYRFLEGVLHSVWEETDFTLFWFQMTVMHVFHFYSMDIKKETERLYGKRFASLNRVWNLKQYLEDGLGVMPERQESMIRYLCKKFEDNHNEKTIKLWLELRHKGLIGKKVA